MENYSKDSEMLTERCLSLILAGEYKAARQYVLQNAKPYESRLLLQLCENLCKADSYMKELSQGNLSVSAPKESSPIIERIKSLHMELIAVVRQMRRVSEGDYAKSLADMGEVTKEFNCMADILSHREEKVAFEMRYDTLTGLLNRDVFMRAVFDMIVNAPDKPGMLISCGMDNLKYINDAYGHLSGDKYLVAAADMYRHFEAMGGIIARISGDEYAIYLPAEGEAEQRIEMLQGEIERLVDNAHVLLKNDRVKIRASYGLALYPEDAKAVDTLMRYASYAMFEVKSSNRGTFSRYNHLMHIKKANLFKKQEKLNKLLEEKLIRFAFQPIIKLADETIFGYEALLRPTLKDFTTPIELLRLAEAQSKLLQFEKISFEVIFEWLDKHISELNGAKIFFNTISSKYLCKEEMEKMHPNYMELCRHMVFEILEIATEEESIAKNIAMFREECNALVAIDDYGCGYSNDLRLISLAPNIVKIDTFFIRDLHINDDKKQILMGIIPFCKSKGIEVLAEGVERKKELEVVKALGFDYAQGFYYAEPTFELFRN